MEIEPVESRYARLQTDMVRLVDQARRYLEMMYGDDVWLRNPASIASPLERWIFALGTSNLSLGEACIKEMEGHVKWHRCGEADHD